MKYRIDYSKIFYPVAHRPKDYIESFETRYDEFDISIIDKIFFEYFGEKPVNVKKSDSWGTSHVIFFVKLSDSETYVFRANNGQTNPEEVMLAEKVITDDLSGIGIPVNKVLYVDISRKKYNFDFQIEEVFKGQDVEILWDELKKDREKCDYISFQIGELIAKMSELKTEKFGLFDLKHLKNNQLVGYNDTFYEYVTNSLLSDLKNQAGMFLESDQIDVIWKLFEEREQLLNDLKGNIVHHDLADHNIAIDPESGKISALFDWESACSGPGLLDLASCPTWESPFPREKHMLDGFRSIKKLPDNWREVFDILKLRTVIWKNLFAVRANLLKKKHIVRWEESLKPFKIKARTSSL